MDNAGLFLFCFFSLDRCSTTHNSRHVFIDLAWPASSLRENSCQTCTENNELDGRLDWTWVFGLTPFCLILRAIFGFGGVCPKPATGSQKNFPNAGWNSKNEYLL